MKIFTIYDSKLEVHGKPFFCPTVGAAVRSFTDEVNSPDSMVSRHPGDFTLFEIGEYDDKTGKVLTPDTIHAIGCGIEFVESRS